jgi:hypothetical protein
MSGDVAETSLNWRLEGECAFFGMFVLEIKVF